MSKVIRTAVYIDDNKRSDYLRGIIVNGNIHVTDLNYSEGKDMIYLLGAKVIEKHFILSKDIDSPDKEFSLTPEEFKQMAQSIREVERALGKVSYELTEKTKKSKEFSRSLFVVKDIRAGEAFTEENIKSIRPGYGLPPKYLQLILGKKAKKEKKKEHL